MRPSRLWITAVISLVLIFSITLMPVSVTMSSGGLLSISVGTRVSAQIVPTNGLAYAKINKSGCQVYKGNCMIRVDFYLNPEDVRYLDTYSLVVDELSPEYLAGYPGDLDLEGLPIDQADYDKWMEALPRVGVILPFHSHFIYLAPTFTEEDLLKEIDLHIGNFYKAFEDGWDAFQGGMRHGWATSTRVRPVDYSQIENVDDYNKRISDCQVAIDSLTEEVYIPDEKGISGLTYPSTEIDVGPGAIDRPTALGGSNYTYVDKTNPSNGTGTLDYFETWMTANATGVRIGTFYGSATNYTNRDGEFIGNVTAGSKQTFSGLDCDVFSGDFIGFTYWGGQIEMTSSGGSGRYYYPGNQFGAGPQIYLGGELYQLSLYGTGDSLTCSSTSAMYPLSITTELVAPEDDNDWTDPTNIGANDGSYASITGPTFDSPDISYRLKAQNFNFTVPVGSTINGILVEIERYCDSGETGADYRVQLLDSTGTLAGTNMYKYGTWNTSSVGVQYGSFNTTWGVSLSVSDVNDTDFGVVLSANATMANADIYVDYIRMTVCYGLPPDISVDPVTYNFTGVAANSIYNTTTTYFTLTNNSTMETDQTISINSSTWLGGANWTHSDTCTPGIDIVGMLANRGGTWGTGDIIIKYSSPNYIYENCPASTNFTFGLSLWTPTVFSDGQNKENYVIITASVS